MKVRKYLFLFLLFFWTGTLIRASAQETGIQIELAPSPIPLNRPFTISIVIRGSEERSYGRFPDLPGFGKRGTSTTTLNDRTGITQRITQTYIANRPGTFFVSPFSMVVNGQTVQNQGGTVVVTPNEPAEVVAETEADDSPAAPATGEVGTDAFLALQANRNRVYVGEGFMVRLSFFVADNSRQELDFYQLNEQIAQILPGIRPANCWEENFGISGEPQRRRAVLGGRAYTEYRIFEAAYFPLNTQPVAFPGVSLNLLGRPTEKTGAKTLRSFRTAPFSVQPRPLPPNPQRDRAAVGDFHWQEALSPSRGTTGQTLTYTIRLTGEGNLAGLNLPQPTNDETFDFYPPEVRQTISRRAGRVSGEKTFSFQLIPKRPGTFALSSYLRLVVFNPKTARYDLLQPSLRVRITGRALARAGSEVTEGIYANLAQVDTSIPSYDYRPLLKYAANAILALLLLGSVVIFWKVKK